MEQTSAPILPPLLSGVPVAADRDIVAEAVALAAEAAPGTVVYAEDDDRFRVALILAPDRPLAAAAGVAFVPLLGLNDALGALCPPEVGVHLDWPFGVRVNGAVAGAMRVVVPDGAPDAEPDWMVLALDLALRSDGRDPGLTPDRTTLADEGCGWVRSVDLIEAWGRHTMLWLHTYLDDGFAPVARAWLAVAHGRDGEVERPVRGAFLGLDDDGGLLVKTADGTRTSPLWQEVEVP